MFSSMSFTTLPGQECAFLWSKLCPKYFSWTQISPIRLIFGYQSLTIHIPPGSSADTSNSTHPQLSSLCSSAANLLFHLCFFSLSAGSDSYYPTSEVVTPSSSLSLIYHGNSFLVCFPLAILTTAVSVQAFSTISLLDYSNNFRHCTSFWWPYIIHLQLVLSVAVRGFILDAVSYKPLHGFLLCEEKCKFLSIACK